MITPLVSPCAILTKNRGSFKRAGQTSGLFAEAASWLTAEKPLTDGKIQNAIASAAVYGYFLSFCTCSFCVDIDDHAGKGAGYLLSIYQTTIGKLCRYPSVVCKTPRGLHAFYFYRRKRR
jgi:hypothetical protein